MHTSIRNIVLFHENFIIFEFFGPKNLYPYTYKFFCVRIFLKNWYMYGLFSITKTINFKMICFQKFGASLLSYWENRPYTSVWACLLNHIGRYYVCLSLYEFFVLIGTLNAFSFMMPQITCLRLTKCPVSFWFSYGRYLILKVHVTRVLLCLYYRYAICFSLKMKSKSAFAALIM